MIQKKAVKAGTFGCTVFQAAEGQGKWEPLQHTQHLRAKTFATLDIPYEAGNS